MYLKSIAVSLNGHGDIFTVYPNGTEVRFVDTTEAGVGRVELNVDPNSCQWYVEATRAQFDQLVDGATVKTLDGNNGCYSHRRWCGDGRKEVVVNYLAKVGNALHLDPESVIAEIDGILDTEKMDDYCLLLTWMVEDKSVYFEYPLKKWCVDANLQFDTVREALKAIFGDPELTEETMGSLYIKALEQRVLTHVRDREEINVPALRSAYNGIVQLATQVGGNMARLALEVAPSVQLPHVVNSAVESIASALEQRGDVKIQNAGLFGQPTLQSQPTYQWPGPIEPGFQRGEMATMAAPVRYRR